MENNIKEKDQFIKDISNYLNELDTQSPIVPTSHITLIRLAQKYGKEKVRNEVNRQLKAELKQLKNKG